MKSAFTLCFLKIMQIKFSAYFTENNMMHIQDTTVIILPWCKSTFLFFKMRFLWRSGITLSPQWEKNMQFFPFACTALVKRGDNGEFHKQIKMRDVS